MTSKPCMAARLFATTAIIIRRKKSTQISEHESSKIPSKTSVSLISKLLTSLIRTEVISLGGVESAEDHRKDSQLRFCSFDCSSVKNPVDFQLGSNKMLEESIMTLYNTVQQLDAFSKQDASREKTDSLREFVDHLRLFNVGSHGERLSEECSKVSFHPFLSGHLLLPFLDSSNTFTYYYHSRQCHFNGLQLALCRLPNTTVQSSKRSY